MNNVYSLGYTGVPIEEFYSFVDDKEAVVLDSRLSPRSRNFAYNANQLEGTIGALKDGGGYGKAGQFVGNLNYKGGPIKFKNPEDGIAPFIKLLEATSIVFICMCAVPAQCHRTTWLDEYLLRDHPDLDKNIFDVTYRKGCFDTVPHVDPQGNLL